MPVGALGGLNTQANVKTPSETKSQGRHSRRPPHPHPRPGEVQAQLGGLCLPQAVRWQVWE